MLPARPSIVRVVAASLWFGAVAAPLAAQPAALVYRLGRDTVAIEQYERTASGVSGEMVQRSGAALTRLRYRITVGGDGRPTGATITRLQPDGTPPAAGVREIRLAWGRDSVVRELVYADSTSRSAFAARGAVFNPPTYLYGATELLVALARRGASIDSLPALGTAGGLGFAGLARAEGDAYRVRGGPYAMVLRFDAAGRLQSVDGDRTTNKVQAVRGPGGVDLGAIAQRMAPTGTLSVRETARAGFGAGGMVLVDYGRPSVRGRTVWGGTLVPFDSVWRFGANDATHLFTTRTLAFEGLTLPPGMYSLWLQHTRTGTILIVNAQTGQWGTQYDASRDVGRVRLTLAPAPAPAETLQIAVRAQGPTRGALEVTWGDRVASAPFTVTAR
jgi:hypothetical protein